jgi:hypothetical protein
MQDVSVMRCSRAPFTAARSSYAGRRLGLVGRPVQGPARRPALRCTAVASADAEVEKRGERRGGRGQRPCCQWRRRVAAGRQAAQGRLSLPASLARQQQ